MHINFKLKVLAYKPHEAKTLLKITTLNIAHMGDQTSIKLK